MNIRFATWTRRTAFSLTLNATAAKELAETVWWEDCLRDPNQSLNGLIGKRVCDPKEYGAS